MIYDSLKNAGRYARIDERITRGLAAIPDYINKPAGRYDINGDKLYITVQRYETKNHAEAFSEAHRKYLDIQYVASGQELIGTAKNGSLVAASPYNGQTDAETFIGDTEKLCLRAGDFIILFPGELHSPGLAVSKPSQVNKLVVKILW